MSVSLFHAGGDVNGFHVQFLVASCLSFPDLPHELHYDQCILVLQPIEEHVIGGREAFSPPAGTARPEGCCGDRARGRMARLPRGAPPHMLTTRDSRLTPIPEEVLLMLWSRSRCTPTPESHSASNCCCPACLEHLPQAASEGRKAPPHPRSLQARSTSPGMPTKRVAMGIRVGIPRIPTRIPTAMAGETGMVGKVRQDLERIRLPGDAKPEAAPHNLKGPHFSTAFCMDVRIAAQTSLSC